MSITKFFERLGAPMKNQRWSWGSIRESDGAVFLKVWKDQQICEHRVRMVRLTHHGAYSDHQNPLGYNERLKHVERVHGGSPCYLIMCRAKDPNASPRKMRNYDPNKIFVGGKLIERDGDVWISIEKSVPPHEVVIK